MASADIFRREALALSELAALQRDPVYRGNDVPRGDGRLVLIIPGLFGNDVYLQPLRDWLRRMGYRPVRSTLVVNAGCPDRLHAQVETGLRRQMARRSGPLAIIGHSRGGMLAWALASRLQADCSHLVLLASPAPAGVAMMRAGGTTMGAGMAAAAVVDAGTRALRLLDPDCKVPNCGCPYPGDLRRDLNPATRVLAVYSRDDRVVSPTACRAPDGENLEISGTHSGLVYNREAYGPLARFLSADPTAQPPA